jgi:intracellular sulfur oxidation DsrE/DsrF family protein
MRRRTFLASSASAAVLTPLAAQAAGNPPGGTHRVERRADFDLAAFEKAVDKPSDVRQLWESVSFHPEMFGNIKNSLNGLQFGYGIAPNRIAMVVCPHGASAAFMYSDGLWSKYRLSEALKLRDAGGNPVTSNTFVASTTASTGSAGNPDNLDSIYQDSSIVGLQKRGVVFLTCHTAVEEQSARIAQGGFAPLGMSSADVATDILTHLIPGVLVVPSVVATVAILQNRYKYSYATLAF